MEHSFELYWEELSEELRDEKIRIYCEKTFTEENGYDENVYLTKDKDWNKEAREEAEKALSCEFPYCF